MTKETKAIMETAKIILGLSVYKPRGVNQNVVMRKAGYRKDKNGVWFRKQNENNRRTGKRT